MKRTDPPMVATWMLEHLTAGGRNDALFGDLLEEFRSGRSASWYWRQVFAAITTAMFKEIRAHSFVLIFATLWTLPARTLWFFIFGFAGRHAIFLWRLSWPDSLFLGMTVLVFFLLWAGLAAYVLLYALIGRSFDFEKVVRGFWIGPVVFILLTMAVGHLSDPLGLPTRGLIKLPPFFFSMAAAAWGVRPRVVSKIHGLVS
jgi:hypothetical protein